MGAFIMPMTLGGHREWGPWSIQQVLDKLTVQLAKKNEKWGRPRLETRLSFL